MKTATSHSNPVTQHSDLRCDLISDFDRLLKLSSEWQHWIDADPLASVFQHRNWNSAVARAYSDTKKVCAIAVYRGPEAIGILPLALRGQTLEFLGAPESDYNDLICKKGTAPFVFEAALKGLLSLPLAWESGVLTNLPGHSRILSAIPMLPPELRKHLQVGLCWPSPTLMLEIGKHQVLERLIDRAQLRRLTRKLEKFGAVSFRHLESREEAREHLGRFFQQHITRCALAGRTSPFLEPSRRAFYESLIEMCDLKADLRFGVLEVGSRPVAYHLGFQYKGKFIWYKPTFDVAYWEYCPGQLLMSYLFRYVRDSDVREFDFSIGDEPFKFRFANQLKQNYKLYLERHPSRASKQVQRVLRYAEHSVRRHPKLKDVLKGCADTAVHGVEYASPKYVKKVLARAGQTAGRTLFRSAIWSHDEALVFSVLAPGDLENSSGIEVTAADLASLASISVAFPDGLGRLRLEECRRRLRRGDRAFVARHDAVVRIFWVTRRDELVISEIGPNCRFGLRAPALVAEECWVSPAFERSPVRPEFLVALAAQCGGAELWCYSLSGQPPEYTEFVHPIYQAHARLSHRSIFHWFRSISVTPVCAAGLSDEVN